LGELPLSNDLIVAEAPAQTAERALSVVWVFDSTLCASAANTAPLLESCRCACCGGLLTVAQRAARGRPLSSTADR
jgi:hypothetical protein